MTLPVCETPDVAAYEPSKRLQAAIKAELEAKTVYDNAMEELYEAIAEEVAVPNRPADVGRYLGYHPGHIRRIAREKGVAPHIDVEPPRRKGTVSDPNS